MHCPVDNEILQMSERSGVEVDYCPRCRGVWLDRGELDKIIERAERELPMTGRPGDDYDREDDRRRDYDRDDDRRREYDRDFVYDRGHGRPHKKRRGFLSEMFEFGDD